MVRLPQSTDAPASKYDAPAARYDATVSPGSQGELDLTKLVETIIAALGEIDTLVSTQTFEQILGGSLSTDDDKTAVDAVLRVLAAASLGAEQRVAAEGGLDA